MLLVGSVSAQQCDAPDYACPDSSESCLYRYVASVSNPKASAYKNALQEDAELVAGSDTTICVTRDDVSKYLDLTGRKDQETTVTAYYELRGSEADDFYAAKTRGYSANL